MTKRVISYTLVLFFLFSSLAYACPEFNSLSKPQHNSSVEEMAVAENPCDDSDHDANPLCQYILHNRISYPAASFSLDKVVPRGIFCLTESKSDFTATAVFRTATASEFHFKLPLTLLYHVLRV